MLSEEGQVRYGVGSDVGDENDGDIPAPGSGYASDVSTTMPRNHTVRRGHKFLAFISESNLTKNGCCESIFCAFHLS